MLPLIAPSVVSGAVFTLATSFDEMVTVLFMDGLEQRTVPRQMWTGIREQISPAILAVASLLIAFSLLFILTVEWLAAARANAVSLPVHHAPHRLDDLLDARNHQLL